MLDRRQQTDTESQWDMRAVSLAKHRAREQNVTLTDIAPRKFKLSENVADLHIPAFATYSTDPHVGGNKDSFVIEASDSEHEEFELVEADEAVTKDFLG